MSASEHYRVEPIDHLLGADVDVPGSKSIANRALICAALADGTSVLTGIAPGDDTAAMLDCLDPMGIRCAPLDDTSDAVEVVGCGGVPTASAWPLDARLAGTTSRFMTALAALARGCTTIDGAGPLRRRPMAPLHQALADLGAVVRPEGEPGHLPVTICGTVAAAAGRVQPLRIRGDVSSQYITALMLIGPYLSDGLDLELTTPLVSRSYVGITAAVMGSFGVHGVDVGEHSIRVPAGRYRACDYRVEPDASSASYPLAAAAIAGGTVHVPGLGSGSLQGDAHFAGLLGAMGCEVLQTTSGTTVTRDGPLRGIDIDMVDMSDLVPTLAVVAPFAVSPTTIRGVGFIRGKESDRIGDLCGELRRAGIRADEHDDGLTVHPGMPQPAHLRTHDDHRLAMSLALLGLVVDGIVIEDPAVVSKSWPGFWAMLEDLR
jgi:3-phosphoshikimate 1-carboxyvinyltransferase